MLLQPEVDSVFPFSMCHQRKMVFECQGHSASHAKLGTVMGRETTLRTRPPLTSKSSKLHFRFVLCLDTGDLLLQGQRNHQRQKIAAADLVEVPSAMGCWCTWPRPCPLQALESCCCSPLLPSVFVREFLVREGCDAALSTQ